MIPSYFKSKWLSNVEYTRVGFTFKESFWDLFLEEKRCWLTKSWLYLSLVAIQCMAMIFSVYIASAVSSQCRAVSSLDRGDLICHVTYALQRGAAINYWGNQNHNLRWNFRSSQWCKQNMSNKLGKTSDRRGDRPARLLYFVAHSKAFESKDGLLANRFWVPLVTNNCVRLVLHGEMQVFTATEHIAMQSV